MKRNESILVYGVGGLLVLILGVSVVFGNERDARSDGDQPQEQELRDAAKVDDQPAPGDDALSLERLLGDLGHPAGPLAKETPAGQPLTATPPAESAADPAAAGVRQPLERRESVLLTLGESRRDGDYRVVKVRAGDSLSVLVERWCGGLEQIAFVEALNEEVDPRALRVGQEVYVPWVEDDVLLAHHKERAVVHTKAEVAAQRTYTLKQGDRLWEIAVQATGSQRKAPEFIERLMALNPGLVPERLRVGQTIVLPQ
jgi:hypothetical protein